jgi:MFS transporter, ACS family, tartrate transporter
LEKDGVISTQEADENTVAERARRRIMLRIMPYLFVLYIIAYLDRANVSYAALNMKTDLGFTDDIVGWGSGIFFVGYFLLEIPGTILVEKWSARGWIARIMISWGILAILTGFVHTKNQFYWIRFFLGAAEAGFFPGIIVYFSHWFRYEDRAKAVALFMAAIPLANMVGAPVSGLLLGVNWLGLTGWRWLFIVEGAPAVVFGVITIFYLTDWPHQAKWLPEDERQWLMSELAREEKAKKAKHSYRILEAFRHREVLLLTSAYFFIVTSVYGLQFWLPTMIKRLSGLSNFVVTSISALPYCVALVAIILMGWSSDRTGERRWHTAGSMIAASAGLMMSVVLQNYAAFAILMFCVAAAGLYGYLPGFWALPTSFLSGTTAAASIGLINSFGNLGGFAGPYIVGYLSEATKSFVSGVVYLSISALLAAVLIISLRATKQRRIVVLEASD